MTSLGSLNSPFCFIPLVSINKEATSLLQLYFFHSSYFFDLIHYALFASIAVSSSALCFVSLILVCAFVSVLWICFIFLYNILENTVPFVLPHCSYFLIVILMTLIIMFQVQ